MDYVWDWLKSTLDKSILRVETIVIGKELLGGSIVKRGTAGGVLLAQDQGDAVLDIANIIQGHGHVELGYWLDKGLDGL